MSETELTEEERTKSYRKKALILMVLLLIVAIAMFIYLIFNLDKFDYVGYLQKNYNIDYCYTKDGGILRFEPQAEFNLSNGTGGSFESFREGN